MLLSETYRPVEPQAAGQNVCLMVEDDWSNEKLFRKVLLTTSKFCSFCQKTINNQCQQYYHIKAFQSNSSDATISLFLCTHTRYLGIQANDSLTDNNKLDLTPIMLFFAPLIAFTGTQSASFISAPDSSESENSSSIFISGIGARGFAVVCRRVFGYT